MSDHFGRVALIGSGETANIGGSVFDKFARDKKPPLRISILETPAGFELNSTIVASRVAQYLETRLQNFQPQIQVVPARVRTGEYSTNQLEIIKSLFSSQIIFMGPGSPSYAVRQLEDSLAWKAINTLHQLGTDLIFSSAACVAISETALPVYEIYKVGEDPHWKRGLNLLGQFGLRLVIVPHWNNVDGGNELDTSRCFIGRARLEPLLAQLDPLSTVLGIDEHTAILLNFLTGECEVQGKGSVHIQSQDMLLEFSANDMFSIRLLGDYHEPTPLKDEDELTLKIRHVQAENKVDPEIEIPPEIIELVRQRQLARDSQAWGEADRLRVQIELQGWSVRDTPEGPQTFPC